MWEAKRHCSRRHRCPATTGGIHENDRGHGDAVEGDLDNERLGAGPFAGTTVKDIVIDQVVAGTESAVVHGKCVWVDHGHALVAVDRRIYHRLFNEQEISGEQTMPGVGDKSIGGFIYRRNGHLKVRRLCRTHHSDGTVHPTCDLKRVCRCRPGVRRAKVEAPGVQYRQHRVCSIHRWCRVCVRNLHRVAWHQTKPIQSRPVTVWLCRCDEPRNHVNFGHGKSEIKRAPELPSSHGTVEDETHVKGAGTHLQRRTRGE